jgi:alpha-galactosidase
MHQHHTVHRLAIEGVLQRDRTRIVQAIQADPLTAAALSLPQIRALAEDLLAANADSLADWT